MGEIWWEPLRAAYRNKAYGPTFAAIMSGKVWLSHRLMEAGLTQSNRCRLCDKENEVKDDERLTALSTQSWEGLTRQTDIEE